VGVANVRHAGAGRNLFELNGQIRCAAASVEYCLYIIEATPHGTKTMTRIGIKRKGALGDVLMATPVVSALKQTRGEHAQIFVATEFPEVFDRSLWVSACLPPVSVDREYFDEFYDLDNVYESSLQDHVIDAYAKSIFVSRWRIEGLTFF
jgi:hypothetical protein